MNEPIRTIVLDDKPLIRKAIVQHVDWPALGCLVVGEAGNGLEGMRLIDECKPDLMVTDIRMPGCDGLELADYMKRVSPGSRVILITGHQEFEYARRAVTVGAFDFILKPIHYTELQRIIAKAAEEMLRERQEEAERLQALQISENYERDFREALPFLRSKLVADYITGQNGQGGGLTERAELLEFQWFMLVHCRLRQSDKMQDREHADRPALPALRQAIAAAGGEWAREAAAAGAEAVQAAVGEDLVLVLMLKHARFHSEERAMAAATACAAHWEQLVLDIAGREGGITASSSLYGHPSQLKEAFAETARQLDAYFFAGFSAGDQPGRSRTVYSQNVKRALEFIRTHYAKTLNLSLVARELNVNPSYLSRILSQETGSSFVELVARARIEAAKRLLKEGQYRVNEVCERVGYKEYNYFYQIFKKYTGMTPTDYKNEKKG
ncbi:MAG: two component transcriptional regulator, arac family protein [Paenibacillaceae bacterium]|jgi:two-component system response regulator YesN|nr:two component transcriptional regulator, arac family protein [Paenibacillaceae bacterium]